MTTTIDTRAWIRLAEIARAIADSESPAAVFRQLVEASGAAAPRVGIYLMRQGQVQGWGSFGYDPDLARRQQAYRAPEDSGWIGRLTAGAPCGHSIRGSEHADPDFGQGPAAEAAGFVVQLGGKPVAVLVAERDEDQSPWSLPAIEMLVSLARVRLELSLAMRGSAGGRKAAPAPRRDPTAEIAPAPAGPSDPSLDAARRFARLVATDIRLYNEEAVVLGRRHGDLGSRLATHLGRGKQTFLKRHSDLGDEGLVLLHEAYVQVLAAGDAALIPPKLD